MTKVETVKELLIKAKDNNLITDYLIEVINGELVYTIKSGNSYYINLNINTTYTYLTNLLKVVNK